MFNTELNYFIENQEELVEKYNGKVLAIKGEEVIGVYENYLEAYFEVQKEHKLGTFALQICAPGPDAYTVTISTQGLFV